MSFIKKWYTYQKERFPVLVYGMYIFCIVFGVFCFNSYWGEINYNKFIKSVVFVVVPEPYQINYLKLIPMFIVAFLQFLMIRIVDEFKDYEEDSKYRPYRPVQRGLVTLKELRVLFIICIITQLLITLIFNTKGIFLLGILWIFFWLLSKDFFMKKVIDKHILIGVFLDELLMPILVLYLSSFIYYIDYSNIWILLSISYIISWLVEVARKFRCKQDEEKGVKTYTAVFGIGGATLILFILQTILMILQLLVLGNILMLSIIGVYLILQIINLLFIKKQSKKMAKIVELSTNGYIMLTYLSLGLLLLK